MSGLSKFVFKPLYGVHTDSRNRRRCEETYAMKFGKDLVNNMVKEWEPHYVDYKAVCTLSCPASRLHPHALLCS